MTDNIISVIEESEQNNNEVISLSLQEKLLIQRKELVNESLDILEQMWYNEQKAINSTELQTKYIESIKAIDKIEDKIIDKKEIEIQEKLEGKEEDRRYNNFLLKINEDLVNVSQEMEEQLSNSKGIASMHFEGK